MLSQGVAQLLVRDLEEVVQALRRKAAEEGTGRLITWP
jgi:hypothetical protein